nr:alpha-amylase family glycosyl hydrolase [uncultured Holophaga sp.]
MHSPEPENHPNPSTDNRPEADCEWWKGAAIYQVYPRSYQDTNGDGIGDLPGITRRLPHIADLGMDAIWISPFFRSPMKDFGYDISDYRGVDPIFGDLSDFDHLVAEAHRLGLRVLIDQVLSHTSDEHPWFKESRSQRENARSDWYVWADPQPDGTPPNNWQSVFGGSAWAWEPRRRQYYLHNFLVSQPDLNFHHTPVQDQLLEEVRFWLERGVDGFRFDACNFHFHDRRLRNNPPAPTSVDLSTVRAGNPYGFQVHKHDKTQPENLMFLKRLRRLMDAYGAVSVGEVGDEDSLATMAQYTADGDKLHMAYGFKLLTDDFSAGRIREVVHDFERRIRARGGWGCWSFSNHDCVRVVTRWGRGEAGSPELPKVLLAVLGTLRGSFCVYQGEELGLPEAEVPFDRLTDPYGIAFWPDFKGRDGCRTPMPWTSHPPFAGFSTVEPWLPIPHAHFPLAVSVQEGDPGSPLLFLRQFLAWRRTLPALRNGAIRFPRLEEPLLAVERASDDQRLLAVFNLGAFPARYTLPAALTPIHGHGLGEGERHGHHLVLPPWGGFFGLLG